MTHFTDIVADATADALSLTQAAMRERCGITVEPVWWAGQWIAGVFQDKQCLALRRSSDLAYAFANELAEECIEAGDLHV